MKPRDITKVAIILLIIAVSCYIALNSRIFGYDIPGVREINLGIDIKGGVSAILEGTRPDGSKPSADELDSAKAKIDTRLTSQGLTDKYLSVDYANARIIVQIPWKSTEKDFNPQKTIEEAIETALLTFREVDEDKVDEFGRYLPLDDKIIIQGDDIKNAKPQFRPDRGTYDVVLEFSSEGAEKFSEATKRLVGKPIAIFMDETLISAPIVQSHITTSSAVIEMNNTGKDAAREAKDLADKIRSGALPIKLTPLQVNSVSPKLGMNALEKTVYAGVVALALVWLFLLIVYRLPGIIANLGLLANVVFTLLALAWIPFTNLTLPGIAGVILSFGMAVDANVIIFERIKEELRSGKTLRTSIELGFDRAFASILDGNVTVVISAVVLWIFGSDTIKGFAYTLGLGVVLSFLTAVTISKILISSLSQSALFKKRWLYGA